MAKRARNIYNTSYYREVKKLKMESEVKLKAFLNKSKNSTFATTTTMPVTILPVEELSCENNLIDHPVILNDNKSIDQHEEVHRENVFFINDNKNDIYFDDENGDDEENGSINSVCTFAENLKLWALSYKITHRAVNGVLKLLNEQGLRLPKDSRTLLETPPSVEIVKMGSGEYWYNGVETCLRRCFAKLEKDTSIALSFNIDGLPISNSSLVEFWPILCLINDLPKTQPMVVAIYSGRNKPNLKDYLSPFVDEMQEILNNNGLRINGYILKVKITCFICDTPARSFVKGIVNFNHYHGCSKCVTIGEYYRDGRHMSYPRIDLPLRTDFSFRNRLDPDHHKEDSPLEKLPIDLVEDFPVADSLHLIDLGVTKKCLLSWMHGTHNFRTKLSGQDINEISEMLKLCNIMMPKEIHRAVRTLDSIKFWKGTEFRTFLLYVGPIVLKDYLPNEVYTHFIILSCAVTICSCREYLKFLPIAENLFKDYVEMFIEIYGIDSVSSNIHNLSHVINDVKKFGPLPSFSAYPFENFLYQIKCLIRHGYRSLAQVTKRIHELSKLDPLYETIKYPFVKNKGEIHVNENFTLSSRPNDKWFLTKNHDIVQMLYVNFNEDNPVIVGKNVKNKHDFFSVPFKSSYINIYSSFSVGILTEQRCYNLSDMKCKLVALRYHNEWVFMPLLHTFI